MVSQGSFFSIIKDCKTFFSSKYSAYADWVTDTQKVSCTSLLSKLFKIRAEADANKRHACIGHFVWALMKKHCVFVLAKALTASVTNTEKSR